LSTPPQMKRAFPSKSDTRCWKASAKRAARGASPTVPVVCHPGYRCKYIFADSDESSTDVDADSESSMDVDASEDEELTVAQLRRQINQERARAALELDEAKRTICDQLVELTKLRADAAKVARVAKRRAEIRAAETENRTRKWLASAAGIAAAPRRARSLALRQAKLEQQVAKDAERVAKRAAKEAERLAKQPAKDAELLAKRAAKLAAKEADRLKRVRKA
jgi:hypothetical protein